MIETRFTLDPPGMCKICKTPTYYKSHGIRVCPVCAMDHDYSDINMEKPKPLAGVKRNVMGDPIIIKYVYSCGHTALKKDVPVSARGLSIAMACPLCKKGKITGKHYLCNLCGEEFYKKGSKGNPLYCEKCAEIRKKESYIRSNRKKMASQPGVQPKIDVVERFEYPPLNILDYISGPGNFESAEKYFSFKWRIKNNNESRMKTI